MSKSKKPNKLQAILKQKEATQESKSETRKQQMAEILGKDEQTGVAYKYKRVTLYLSPVELAWANQISQQLTLHRIKTTKSLLYSIGLKQLQKMSQKELEDLVIEEAKKRALDLI